MNKDTLKSTFDLKKCLKKMSYTKMYMKRIVYDRIIWEVFNRCQFCSFPS